MARNKQNRTVKNVLFASIISLLFLPMIQQKTKLIDLKPLSGSFETLKNPYFSSHDWFEGKYQTEQQNYLNQSIGFRNFFVRLYNQMHYTLYNQAKANGVVIGKEGYLYEENYIKAHLGIDFIGEDKIREKTEKLKRISATLKGKGIDLIILLAPGKGSFYPEFIPKYYHPKSRSTTNYGVYKRALLEAEVHLLDFHSWFNKLKNTAPYPLFPKTGIHWSKYGEVLAADSLINYINSIRKEKSIPHLRISDIITSTTIRDSDDDIEKGMNLLFGIEDLPMGYPHFEIQQNNSPNKVKVLTVADSYYWGMFNWGCSRDAFNEGQFWFYNKQIYPDSYTTPVNVDAINIIEQVEKNDVVILLSTDANLYKFAFGFIDQLYDGYFNLNQNAHSKKGAKEERIQFYIHAIKETPEWIESIKKKASEENIPLDEAIRKDAEYMVWSEDNGQ